MILRTDNIIASSDKLKGELPHTLREGAKTTYQRQNDKECKPGVGGGGIWSNLQLTSDEQLSNSLHGT